MKRLFAVATVVGAIVAVERLYVHPTYGNGVRALVAAIQAGELFA